MYNGRKVNIKKLLQISFPTHQESSLLKTHTRKYGRNIERCASEISLGQLHRRSKISTSLLFGTRFMRMMARWKDNLMNFNLEGCFSTCSICSGSKKKIVEDEAVTRTRWKSVMTI
jgi:anti-sigma-K factor RskA